MMGWSGAGHQNPTSPLGLTLLYLWGTTASLLFSTQLSIDSCDAWVVNRPPLFSKQRPPTVARHRFLAETTRRATTSIVTTSSLQTGRRSNRFGNRDGADTTRMMSSLLPPGEVIRRVDGQGAKALVDKYDTFIFDCDGVLWAGSHAIDGSLDVLKALRRAGKRTFFVTNNSSKSRRQYCLKLDGFGVRGVCIEDVITSGAATAAYIKNELPEVKAVYMVGEAGLEEELEMVGLRCVKEEDRPAAGMTEDEFRKAELDPEVGAVVVGYDTSFGFRQMCMASLYIQRGAPFVGTNSDLCDRVGSRLMPGTGPLLAAIESASGITPVVIGKPNPILIRRLMDEYGLVASRTLMVGDRLDTDIMFGNAGGISTALVLTGVSEMGDVSGLVPGGASTPTYLMEDLRVLLPAAEIAATLATQRRGGAVTAEQSAL